MNLSPDDNGTPLVTVPDIPEAVTYGEGREDALACAVDTIEIAINGAMAAREDAPASKAKGRDAVVLPALSVAKIELYRPTRVEGVGKAAPAKRLGRRAAADRPPARPAPRVAARCDRARLGYARSLAVDRRQNGVIRSADEACGAATRWRRREGAPGIVGAHVFTKANRSLKPQPRNVAVVLPRQTGAVVTGAREIKATYGSEAEFLDFLRRSFPVGRKGRPRNRRYPVGQIREINVVVYPHVSPIYAVGSYNRPDWAEVERLRKVLRESVGIVNKVEVGASKNVDRQRLYDEYCAERIIIFGRFDSKHGVVCFGSNMSESCIPF